MNSATVRSLKNSDFPTIHQWFLNPVFHFYTNPTLAYPIQIAELAAQLKTAEKAVGLFIEKKLVGSGILRKQNEQLELTYLFVAHAFRGNSYAKQLISELVNGTKSRPILAKTLHGQRELERLLKEVGFEKNGAVENHLFEGKEYAFHHWTLI
jgi:citrate lyase synthetase